jgi:hypothetical protein
VAGGQELTRTASVHGRARDLVTEQGSCNMSSSSCNVERVWIQWQQGVRAVVAEQQSADLLLVPRDAVEPQDPAILGTAKALHPMRWRDG